MIAVVPEAFIESAASCPRWHQSVLEHAIIQLHAWQQWQSIAGYRVIMCTFFEHSSKFLLPQVQQRTVELMRYRHDDCCWCGVQGTGSSCCLQELEHTNPEVYAWQVMVVCVQSTGRPMMV